MVYVAGQQAVEEVRPWVFAFARTKVVDAPREELDSLVAELIQVEAFDWDEEEEAVVEQQEGKKGYEEKYS